MNKSQIIKIKNRFISEFTGWSKIEAIFSVLIVLITLCCSIYLKDSILAIIAGIFGLLYTIIAGKGKVSCYFFGIIGTLCCAYVSYEIKLFGYFFLHLLYYFPMEILGFINWNKHLQKNTNEIIKTKLQKKELILLLILSAIATFITYIIFMKTGDNSPIIDALVTVLSITGMILTVKRCIEQWLIWTLVNFLTILMWLQMFIEGERIFAILFVRIIYFFLGIYFFIKWREQMKLQEK